MLPWGELLVGEALKGEGPLASLEPALDSPSCCTLRQSELERRCFAGLHPLVAAVSARGSKRACALLVPASMSMCASTLADPYACGWA